MQTVRKKEIYALIDQVENQLLKTKLNDILNEMDNEINTEDFFTKIKQLDIVEDNDYSLMLLLEEFYNRFKDLEV
jgi:hypothetical protein